MNSSKKIVGAENKQTKKGKVSVPERKLGKIGGSGHNIKAIVLSVCAIAIIVVLCVGVAISQFKPEVVMTIDGKKITMSDMMYPIYEVESQYTPYNEMYEAYTGTSFWESDYQGSSGSEQVSGVTNSMGLKQEILTKEAQYRVLENLAKKNKLKLTKEEKKQANADAKEALDGLSWLQKLQLDFTESKLTTMFERRTLALKYKDKKQEELNKDVKEDDATKDIKKADYRQYDVQYYYASINESDDDGNTTPVADDKKKALKAKIESIAKKAAKKGADFTKLSDESDKDITFEKDGNFTQKDGFTYLSEENLNEVKKMKNGSVSKAFIDEKAGYYIVVKMINNNSDEAYKEACDSAIKSAQDEAFNTWYTEEETKHKINVNTDIWTDVTIGSVTTDIVTAEDLNDMKEDSSDATSGSNK